MDSRSGRMRLEKPFSTIKLNIPVKRNVFISFFLLFLLLGWGFFEWFLTVLISFGGAHSHSAEGPLVLPFFVLWTLGGLILLSILSWRATGREQMIAGNGQLKMIQKSWFYYRSKTYAIDDISRISAYADNSSSNALGGIAFKYRDKWVRIAKGLDAVDAKYVLDKLKENGILQA
ncbi:MAG: hypothetical protein ACHQRM_11035 [Bacteroidia bacterium]